MLKMPKRQRSTDAFGNATKAEQQRVERLKDKLLEKRGGIDHNTAAYVQAALDYGVELTRSEYRPLANRNWRIIQRFGVRLMRTLALFFVVLLGLGVLSYHNITEIQSGRKNSVLEKCHAGEAFDHKLKARVKRLPEPAKREAEAQEAFTEELVATVVPISHDHCAKALRAAGL